MLTEIKYDVSSVAAEITIINPGGAERGGKGFIDIQFLRDNI